jgi:hypothetical protein
MGIKKRRFYIITSPMQLINAYEYKTRVSASGDHNHLRIFYHFTSRKSVFEECLKMMDWDHISFSYSFERLGIKGFTGVGLNLFREFFYQLGFNWFCRRKYDEIIFGHYLAFVQRGYLKKYSGRLTLVDDGNFSFQVSGYRKQEEEGVDVVIAQKYDRINSIMLSLFSAPLKGIPINFFTIYPINPLSIDSVTKNDYSGWNNLLVEAEIDLNNEKNCWIIGSDYVENGWMKEGDYLSYMEKISNSHADFKIKYVKKWSESKEKLKKLPESMEVVSFDLPMEVVLLKSKIRPTEVYGFISSVLFNMSRLFSPNINFNMIIVPEKELSTEGQNYFSKVYTQGDYFPINKSSFDIRVNQT